MEATLASIVAAAAPLIYATMGETITEKAGVINLSLEGTLRLAAMAGFVAALVTGHAVAGFAAAALVGAALASVIALASIELRLNQIAIGFVLTLLAVDLAIFLGDGYVGIPGVAVRAWPVPFLSRIPWLGPVLFDHNLSVYGSYLAIGLTWWYLSRTRAGLILRGVGERPEAAWARGVAVNRLRYRYTILGGALAGMAGAAFSLDVKLGWRETLTLNFGWIALAIVIFGGWHPVRVALGCYMFGALQVAAFQLQGVFPQLAQVLPLAPFPLMILALVVVHRDWFRRLGDRLPRWRELLAADPPGAAGTAFEPD